MAAFLGALGSGALQYAKARAMSSPVGRAIAGGMDRYRAGQHPQVTGNTMDRSPVPDVVTPGGMPPADASNQAMSMDPTQNSGELAGLSPDLMAQGKIVTSPTRAIIGERGPEAVVPLNDNPQNRVTPAILNSLTPRYRGGDKLRLRVPHVR